MRDPMCGKCGGTMQEGFMVDNGYARVARPEWAEGEIVPSFWTGGVQVSGRTRLTVHTWRCTECGFLESYAPE